MMTSMKNIFIDIIFIMYVCMYLIILNMFFLETFINSIIFTFLGGIIFTSLDILPSTLQTNAFVLGCSSVIVTFILLLDITLFAQNTAMIEQSIQTDVDLSILGKINIFIFDLEEK